MLAGANRLKKAADFSRVFQQPTNKIKVGPLLFITAGVADQPTRLGIVVSKKVSKKAVERNHLKRVLSHELRRQIEAVVEKYPGDTIILVLHPVPEPHQEFQKAITTWLTRAKKSLSA